MESAKLSREKRLVEIQKIAAKALPPGWVLADEFRVDDYPALEIEEKSPGNSHVTFDFVANPTTLMVEAGEKETRFAWRSFGSTLFFPEIRDSELPVKLKYPGKNPPRTIGELMDGKTFVAVHEGGMWFRMEVDVKQSGETIECNPASPPKPMDLQPTNQSIYPLTETKPETYLHGAFSRSPEIDSSRLLATLVKDSVEKREAELKADGIDREKERNRVGETYRLEKTK